MTVSKTSIANPNPSKFIIRIAQSLTEWGKMHLTFCKHSTSSRGCVSLTRTLLFLFHVTISSILPEYISKILERRIAELSASKSVTTFPFRCHETIMRKAWKDDSKSMNLPSGKAHFRFFHIIVSSLPVSTLFQISDVPVDNACLFG